MAIFGFGSSTPFGAAARPSAFASPVQSGVPTFKPTATTTPTTPTTTPPVTTAAPPTVAPQQQQVSANSPSPLTHGWTAGMVGPSYRILQSILGPGSGVTTQGAPLGGGTASPTGVPPAVGGPVAGTNSSGLTPAVDPNINPQQPISSYWMSLDPATQKQLRKRVGSNLLNTLLEGSGSSKSQYYSLLPGQQSKIQKKLTPEQLAGLTGLSTSQYNFTYGQNGWVPGGSNPALLY
jgi:hypothetical protein